MIRRFSTTVLREAMREAMMVFIMACFALGTVVSLKDRARHGDGKSQAGAIVICLHDGGSVLAQAIGLAAEPAAPLDDSAHCHADCALCGGHAPTFASAGTDISAEPAFAALPATHRLPPLPRLAGSLVHVPPKQGPPRIG